MGHDFTAFALEKYLNTSILVMINVHLSHIISIIQ